MGNLQVVLGGKAVVCCVHDRKKREIVAESQIASLGLEVGIVFDSKIHKLFKCACCENLFVGYTDEPKYCDPCTAFPVHALGGALPEPKGAI